MTDYFHVEINLDEASRSSRVLAKTLRLYNTGVLE